MSALGNSVITCVHRISFQFSGRTEIFLPNNDASIICLMLSGTYYAQNYAGIIGWSIYRCKETDNCQWVAGRVGVLTH